MAFRFSQQRHLFRRPLRTVEKPIAPSSRRPVAFAVITGLLTSLLTFSGASQPESAASIPVTDLCRSTGDGSTAEADATKNGFFESNNLSIEPIYAKRMYADLSAGYNAMYIGYRIENTSNNVNLDNLWLSLSDFSAAIQPTQPRQNDVAIGSLAAGAATTEFFFVAASEYTTQTQSHVVTVSAGPPGLGQTQSACRADIDGVYRSISAKANKVTSISTSGSPALGQSFTITVQGTPGKVGNGDSPDGAAMTLSPANTSSWPSGALTLETAEVLMQGVQNANRCDDTNGGRGVGNTSGKTTKFTNELILRDFGQCAANTKQSYTTTYTFRVTGSLNVDPVITPVSDISSGTQMKYTGGYPSESTTVEFSELSVASEIDNAEATKTLTSTNVTGGRLEATFSVAVTSTGAVTIDGISDFPSSGMEFVSNSAQFTDTTRTNEPITPLIRGTDDNPELRFPGPFSLDATDDLTLTYTVSYPLPESNSSETYSNTAYGYIGSFVIASNTNQIQGIELLISVDQGGTVTATDTVITEKLPQTISFSTVSSAGAGTSLELQGFSDSGLPVSYDTSTGSVCTLSQFDGTWTLTLTAQGSCLVRALQAGDSDYAEAPPVTREITVLPGQTISHSSITLSGSGDTENLSVQSTSNLQVTLTVLTVDECSLSNEVFSGGVTTVDVTGNVSGGTCIVLSTQAGDGTSVGPAVDVEIVIGIGSAQHIVFLGLTDTLSNQSPPAIKPSTLAFDTSIETVARQGVRPEPYPDTPPSPTILATSLTSLTPAVCSVLPPQTDSDGFISELNSTSGVTTTGLRLINPGECRIQANQDGFDEAGEPSAFAAAPSTTYTFTIEPNGSTSQTITGMTDFTVTYGDPEQTVTAEASSALLVSLEGTDGVCAVGRESLANAITSASIQFLAAGSCVVRATQAGDSTYSAAPEVTWTITVATKELTVSGLSVATKTYDGTTAATLSGTPTLGGVVANDSSLVSLQGSPSGVFDTPNVGTGKPVTVSGLSLHGTKASNYRLASINVSGSITTRSVSLTPSASTIQEGSQAPTSCTVTVGGQGLADRDVLSNPSCTYGSYTDQSPSGDYDVTLASYDIKKSSVDVSGNYAISINTGVLTVSSQSVPEIDGATEIIVVYGEDIAQAELDKPTARKNSQQVSGTIAHKLPDGSTLSPSTRLAPGQYNLTVEFIPDSGSGFSSAQAARELTIEKRPILYSFNSPSKVYDGTNTVPLGTFTLESIDGQPSGVVTGDDVSVSAPSQGTLTSANVGTHTLNWSGPQLTGIDAGNYDLRAPGAKNATITARPLSIRVDDHARLVGEANPAFALLASNGGQNEGLAAGEDLVDAVGSEASVSVDGFQADQVGSYTLRPTTPNASANYTISTQTGTLYIADISISVNETAGVLDTREVVCTCEGLQPNTTATFTIFSTPTTLATLSVDSNGECPQTRATIPDSVADGDHTLEVAGLFPTGSAAEKTRPVRLGSSQSPPPEDNRRTDPPRAPRSRDRAEPPGAATPATPRVLPFQPGPRIQGPPNQGSPNQDPRPATPTAPSSPQPVPGGSGDNLPAPRVPSPPEVFAERLGNPQNTFDLGDTVGAGTLENRSLSSSREGLRSLNQLANEPLSGFQASASLKVEVMGSRTTSRFVLSSITGIDELIYLEAIERSAESNNTDFAAITAVSSSRPPASIVPWEAQDRAVATEIFAASRLGEPQKIDDLLGPEDYTWINLQSIATGYLPGSTIYLTATSSPVVFGEAVVGPDGSAAITGDLPLEILGVGEHRIRVVGVRTFDGIVGDGAGGVVLPDEVLAEIARFDLGTDATVLVSGDNGTGGTHTAVRIVPLDPVSPWWTLWVIFWTALLVIGARLRGMLVTRTERALPAVAILVSSLPAIYLGWTSTVTAVTWWGLALGVALAVLGSVLPALGETSRQRQRAEQMSPSASPN